MPAFQFLSRSDESKDSSPTMSNPVYITGIVVIAVIGLGVAVWLGLHFHRKRAAARRQLNMGAAFFSVKGLVPDRPDDEKAGSLQRSATMSHGFSRANMNSGVVMPEKTLARPGKTREEILEYHRQSGIMPNSFAPKPFSFALGAASPRNSFLEPPSNRSSNVRSSFMSFSGDSQQNRFSVMSSVSSVDVHSTSGSTRKVRQLYEPVLPDEILINLGEQLTVVQSFDDGWCVVGRENSSFVHTAKSLFKTTPEPENNVELGVVPAWCFLKPVKGLRAERPVRSSSLGITVNLDAPGFGNSSRNDLASWSNF